MDYKKIQCAAAMIKDFRERAKSCGVSLSGDNYKEILDESDWLTYEMSVEILASYQRQRSLAMNKLKQKVK